MPNEAIGFLIILSMLMTFVVGLFLFFLDKQLSELDRKFDVILTEFFTNDLEKDTDDHSE